MTTRLSSAEQRQNDAASLGPILGEESIIRSALTPRHERNGKIKRDVFRTSDLKQTQLSAWRACHRNHSFASEVITELDIAVCRQNPPQAVYAYLWATASEIRSIDLTDSAGPAHCFCIIDNCECDPTGRKHPQHVNLGLSEALLAAIGEEKDSPHEVEAIARLKLLMEHRAVRMGD